MKVTRCDWATQPEIMTDYHYNEWGRPIYNEQKLFEFLSLEGAQAGLSWLTILKRREGYRSVFHDFNVEKVAEMDIDAIQLLLQNQDIIRNKLKIKSVINNARMWLKISSNTSMVDQLWQFVDGVPIKNHFQIMTDVPATTKISDAMSKWLKSKGFSFVGSTICYAFMQATGMVNDHLVSCDFYNLKKQ